MLNYGTQQIDADSEDEEGRPTTVPVPLAELLVHEIRQDQIIFGDTAAQNIFEEYARLLDSGTVPDLNYFTHHPQAEISKYTIDMVSIPYSLSNWERHFIYVQTEDMILKNAALHGVYALKLRRIEMMLHENQKELRNAANEEELLRILQQTQQLLEAKKYFSGMLGRVVVR